MVDDDLAESIAMCGVTAQQFRRQMGYLYQHGYQSITLREWFLALRGDFDLPPKPIAITFDDAYRDLKEIAWPILQQYGFKPVVIAVAEGLGKTNFWDERIGLPSRHLLNVEE
jgi:peptidoglycan/xylan/chitin deacetylase (PgdA/CDA1 family)